MPTLSARYCSNHPEIHALAHCMSCRKTLCADCATTWQGVNYCSSCFSSIATDDPVRTGVGRLVAVLLLSVLLAFVASRVFVMIGVIMSGAFSE